MNTILVTGGAGFIGSCLVRQLVAAGKCGVVNLDKLTYAGSLDAVACVADSPHYHFVQGDIGDRDLVAALLKQFQPTAVINLAAETHVDRSIDDPMAFVETNVAGTCRLLEAVRDYWSRLGAELRDGFRLLQVSTDEVYGSLDSVGSFHEDSPYAPNSPYAASKAAADHFVRAYHQTYGLPTLISHASNNYGPYQFPEKLVPLMILNAIEGKSLPVYGDGTQIRDWLHVEDHCRALVAILQKGRPGALYHVGGHCERTNLQVVQTICQAVERLVAGAPPGSCSARITHVPDRPGHDRRYALDGTRIRSQLGWEPRHEFASGIEQTVQWYLDHRSWVDVVEAGGFHRERMGLKSARPSA